MDRALTPLGQTLLEPVLARSAWTQQHAEEITAAREKYDEASARRDLRTGS